MNKLIKIVLPLILFSLAGCSTETWKRTGYETLQNVKQQQCQKGSPAECAERESYNAYQDKLRESEKIKSEK
jgi:hypothetical protein